MKKPISTILFSIALGVSTSHGALIAYEGMSGGAEYAAGQNLENNTGGTGFGGAWANTGGGSAILNTPPLTYTGLATQDETAVDRTGGGNMQFGRSLSATTTDDVIYASFLIDNSSNTGPGVMRLTDQGGTTNISFGLTAAGGVTNAMIGTGWVSASTTSVETYGTGTHFIVAEVNFTTDTVSLYVDPVISATKPGSPTISQGGFTTQTGISGISIVNWGGAYKFDELRIANTWADAVSVPELSTLHYLSLGALLMLRLRRRNKKQV